MRFPPCIFPACPDRPRRAAARRRRDRDAADRRRAQPGSGPAAPAVPFVELGQVVDKGALRLLPSRLGDTPRDRRPTAVRSATPRPRARWRCTTSRASGPRRCSTSPMSWTRPAAIERPVTFVFNGGPGAASAYLHLGLVGPRLAEFRRRPRGPAATARQSADLAAIHRPRDDRPGRLRLQPAGAGRRRQRVLGRGARRRGDGEGDRAVDRRQPPHRRAEVHPGRELRRLPRRQGGERAAPHPWHRGQRHHDGVAADGRRLHVRRHAASRSAPPCRSRRSPPRRSNARAS